MKNGKKPSLAQKKIMQQHGFDSSEWLVVKDLNDTLEIVNRSDLKKGNMLIRTRIIVKSIKNR